MLVITGAIDLVLTKKMTQEFRLLAEKNGATVYDGANYAHPFMDANISTHLTRLKQVITFFETATETPK